MRKYQPAWEKLKAEKIVKIAAHPLVHARILKAIIKEKDIDLVFKLTMAEDCRRVRISHKSKSGELILYLNFSIGISDL